MSDDLKSTKQPVPKETSRFNWVLVLGISIIVALIFAIIFYWAYLLFNIPNTSSYENNGATKSAERNPLTTETKNVAEQKLVITEKDFGQLFSINNGQQVFLRLSETFDWLEPEPKTTGDISLKEVSYENDLGYREWQVSYTKTGIATIESNIKTGTLGTDAEITKFFVTLKIQPN